MGHCKDCRWWKRDGVCDFADTVDVLRDKANPNPSAAAFAIAISADDDQGLDVWLRTGPEFGCVHFAMNGGE